MSNTFLHSGDIGDIVCAMPAMRALGGGILYIAASNKTRLCMTPDKWCGIDKLLRMQPYVQEVAPWQHQRVDFSLDNFRHNKVLALRQRRGFDTHLADWVLDTFAIPRTAKDVAWLRVDEPKRVARVVINRSGPGRPPHQVYHSDHFPWHDVWTNYKGESVFIGLPLEHEVFCRVHGHIPYCRTEDLLDAARVIAGCDLFVGNQSACHTIAEGMKKNILLEVWRGGPNVLAFRQGVTHGWDHKVELPNL